MKLIKYLLFFFLFLMPGWVYAGKGLACREDVISAIASKLHDPQLQLSDPDESSSDEPYLTAATCKTAPANRLLTIAAIAYDPKSEYEQKLVIAVVDKSSKTVVAIYQGKIAEEGGDRLASDSLEIKPYQLTKRGLTFALDTGFIKAYHSSTDGGYGDMRTLYVQDGEQIRPISDELLLSEWQYVKGYPWLDSPALIIESLDVSLRVAPSVSNGFHDLVVTGVATFRDDNKIQQTPALRNKRKRISQLIKYDGRRYSWRAWNVKNDGVWGE